MIDAAMERQYSRDQKQIQEAYRLRRELDEYLDTYHVPPARRSNVIEAMAALDQDALHLQARWN